MFIEEERGERREEREGKGYKRRRLNMVNMYCVCGK